MVKVVGVRFKHAGKVYYFDPADFQMEIGSSVIVETARGTEFGTINMGPKEIPESQIVAPLKKIIRIANEKDCRRYEENNKKKDRALSLCEEKIVKHKLDMKLIDVEYTFDNSKIIFYFTADGRVDFRDLVKDLAGVFKMRIELRQIGVRDEAKMIGGIGTCGKGLCCHTWLPEFEPVSIKMAKVQNLSLNPTKISGICGRLMCCLKYENDTYLDLRKGMPDYGERIKVPDGEAIVVDTNILKDRIKTRMILEESEKDHQLKLSTEFYYYKKEEIKRIGKNRKPQKRDDEKLPEEIKNLLKD
ncbi:MAG: stage 0 sporulation family protein [Anaerovoracaceae bacterium]